MAGLRRRIARALDPGPGVDFETAERSLLDLPRLAAVAARHREAYAAAEPFPHAVVDGLFDDAVLERVLREFSTERTGSFVESLPGHVAAKRSLRDEPGAVGVSTFVRFFLAHLNSIFFVEFLQGLAGIPDLIPDPWFDGGGLHETLPGGFLDVHADFNFHGAWFLDRRLNVLVYLNHDWREEWGGCLELWDRDLSHCVKKVVPAFNRTVIFGTNDVSFHGHPEPVRCPPGRSRKSVATYYYSNGRPEAERSQRHTTLWRKGGGGVVEG